MKIDKFAKSIFNIDDMEGFYCRMEDKGYSDEYIEKQWDALVSKYESCVNYNEEEGF